MNSSLKISSKFKRDKRKIEKIISNLPRKLGKTATQAFQDNFRNQNFFGGQRWKPRKGGNLALIGFNNSMMNAFSLKVNKESLTAIIRNRTRYAAKHNDSFSGRLYQQKREIKATTYRNKSGKLIVRKAHTRKAYYQNVTLPKRKFMGNSIVLDRKIRSQINSAFGL